jgi:Leucine-rich repeat (LRR) protein
LERLTPLQSLDLSNCDQLSGDLSPLASLTSLQSLNLSLCIQLSGDLSPLAGLSSLQSLNLSNCQRLSGDLSPLAGLTSLQSLNLTNCQRLGGNLSLLASLTSLQSLDLTGCQPLGGNLSPLVSLTSLQSLNLSFYFGIRRFAPLKSLLPTLEYLCLLGCKFDDLPSEICGKIWGENALGKVRAHYRQRLADASPKIAPPQPLGTPPQIFVSYAWGNISPNATQEDHQRQEVVERLCRKLEDLERR